MIDEELDSWAFGDSSEMADKLLSLVLQGRKRATCGALWDYEFHKDALPKENSYEIILDGKGKPACKIKNVSVRIIKFNEVDEEFAAAEGEGDLTLENWQALHESFFRRNLPKLGKEFSEDMPLVCVNFEVGEIYEN